ncbi:MAG: hypothetical protein AYK18_07025 [Theionarchaea archaeon DG-70]|nr:MAG: hypothetical protein AYK18_07025 [Theionarchaea archaeon DG-70]
MNERKKKGITGAIFALVLIVSIVQIATAEPRIKVTQTVKIDRWNIVNEEGDVYWSIGEVSRVGPGGYAPIHWCVTNEDEDFAVKGYFIVFILDPELTLGGMDWETIKEEANGPTGYRWDFGDTLKYMVANSYILSLMGNYARVIYNGLTSNNVDTIDLDVCLAITDKEPEDPNFFSKFLDNKIFGITMRIPPLEPTSRSGRHSWCVEEGFDLKWYERINILPPFNPKDAHCDALPYVVIGRDARIGDKHKLVALVCSADPNSAWQWTSFNVISYEEITFIIEKPKVNQTLTLAAFAAFILIGWWSGLFKKLGKFFRLG